MSLMRYAVEHVIEDVFATKADGIMVYANGQIRQHYCLKDEEDMSCINIKVLPSFQEQLCIGDTSCPKCTEQQEKVTSFWWNRCLIALK